MRETRPSSESPRVLDEARRLAAAGDWPALAERVSALPEGELLAEPELGYLAADAYHRLGRMDDALRLVGRIDPLVRRSGDHRLALRLINLSGVCLFASGRTAEAEERFGELMEAASHRQDEEFAARASNNLGVLANVRGRRDLALNFYQRALASYQRLGYLRGLAQTHHNLGVSYRDLGFTDKADSHFLRAIEFGKLSGSEDVIGYAESERAMLCVHAGDGSLAESLAQRAMERFQRLGDQPKRAEALRVLAAAARTDGDCDLAAERLGQALEISRAYRNPLLRAEVQRDRGLLLRGDGKPDAAREAFLDAALHFERLGAESEATLVRAWADELPPRNS